MLIGHFFVCSLPSDVIANIKKSKKKCPGNRDLSLMTGTRIEGSGRIFNMAYLSKTVG